MSTWVGHFRIAERLLETLPDAAELDATTFILANVAPDSGRPNHDWTAFDPPKRVTHFLQPGEDEGRIPDLWFYREHVQPSRGHADYSFLLAYFTHLMADNLWMHMVGDPTKRQFAGEFAADRSGTWDRVKDDWYGLDHKFLRDYPDSVFARVVVPGAHPPSPLSFLPGGALAERLDGLREFYREPAGFVLDRAYPYLSEARMTHVVEQSSRLIRDTIMELERGGVPREGRVSLPVLALPEPDALP